MTDFGKLLISIGLIICVAGLLIWGLGRVGFRGLPGDIRYEGQHVRFYFPVVTSLVLSALLTLILWLLQWFRHK
ncbi:MAG TPA: DUF2905 domain-containing protein [Tepidisphaeraceae bacterium]|nr:DUF2905 domain-containing protein [Tepidisphaeraceae bacterium]